MQIQRFTGPKHSFELTLDSPVLQLSKNMYMLHMWQRKGNHYTCTMFLEATRDPDEKNEKISRWVGALPIKFLEMDFHELEPGNKEELLDVEVRLTKDPLLKCIVDKQIIGYTYERYLQAAAHAYRFKIVEPHG